MKAAMATKRGDVIRIWYNTDTTKDDFNLLVSAIRERVAQQNAATTAGRGSNGQLISSHPVTKITPAMSRIWDCTN